jgi:hypothetical protein
VDKRAKWVNAICVTAIVLGCLGFCCDLFGLGGMVMTGQLAKLMPDQRAAFEASMKHRPLLIAWACVQLVYTLALIVTGALALGTIERHARYLRLVFRIGIPCVVLGVLLTAFVQLTQNVTLAGQNEAITRATGAMRVVSLVVLIGWTAIKVAFFAWGDRYLAHPLEPIPPPPTPPPLEPQHPA